MELAQVRLLVTDFAVCYRFYAEVLGLPQNRVRVIGPYLGGGFGGKEDVTVEVFLGLLAWRTQRPVKMIWSRQESLLARPKRHPFILRYRTGAARDGRLASAWVLGDLDGLRRQLRHGDDPR